MSVGTLISVDEYLRKSLDPDCDFVDGEILERHVGKRKHSFAQLRMGAWFVHRREALRLEAFTELRMRVGPGRIRIPDIVVCEVPIPDEEVFTAPPYLCIEVMSPDDTMAATQDRLDDYLQFGVQNIWVVDPWKHRGWNVTAQGWATNSDGIMRTADGRIAMRLVDVLLP
jgi:Uma2 family endonuclease